MLGEEDNMFKVHVMTSKKQTLALSFYKIILTLNKKVNYKTVIECVKDVKIYLYTLKKTFLSVLE